VSKVADGVPAPNDGSQGGDLLVGILDTDVFANVTGNFGAEIYNSSFDNQAIFSGVGYSLDLGNELEPIFQGYIAITSATDLEFGAVLEFQGTVVEGDSGGPIWADFSDNGGLTVVGIYGAPANGTALALGGLAMIELLEAGAKSPLFSK
jgi:hypothetical protein